MESRKSTGAYALMRQTVTVGRNLSKRLAELSDEIDHALARGEIDDRALTKMRMILAVGWIFES